MPYTYRYPINVPEKRIMHYILSQLSECILNSGCVLTTVRFRKQTRVGGWGGGEGITTGGAHLGCLTRSSRVSSRGKGAL